MKRLFATLWGLAILAAGAGQAHAVGGVYATVTLDVTTIKLKDVVQGCVPVAPVLPTSAVLIFYDDWTFEEDYTVNGNPVVNTGTWGYINDARKTLHMSYTGNPGDRTGTWGSTLSGVESVALASCGATVTADGATFRVKKQDIVLTVSAATALTGICSGNASVSYQLEGYGTNSGTGLPVKITRQVTAKGVVTLGPSGGC